MTNVGRKLFDLFADIGKVPVIISRWIELGAKFSSYIINKIKS